MLTRSAAWLQQRHFKANLFMDMILLKPSDGSSAAHGKIFLYSCLIAKALASYAIVQLHAKEWRARAVRV